MIKTVRLQNLTLWLGVLVVMLASTTLAFFLLKRGHVWGDDFAGYLLQTRALLQGNPFDLLLQNQWMNEQSVIAPGPDVYPWGYPLLILPVYMIWGVHPLAIKAVNLIFFAVSLLFLALILYRYDNSWRTAVVMASFAFLPAILDQTDYINSDPAFLAVTMVCLWMVSVWQNIGIGKAALFGFFVFIAAFIRTTGVFLWVLFLVQYLPSVFQQKNWKLIVAAVAAFLVPFLVQSVLLPQGNSSYFSHFELFTLPNFYQNTLYYLRLPAVAFSQLAAQSFFYVFFLVLAGVGIGERRDPFFGYLAFSSLLLVGYILWPERQGLRFVLPILPVLWILTAAGQRVLAKRSPLLGKSAFWLIGMIALYAFYLSTSNAVNNIRNQRAINGPFDAYSTEVFEYIRANATPQDAVAFFKPRALRLLTKNSYAYAARDCDSLAEASLVVINLKQDAELQLTPDGFMGCSVYQRSEQVFENRRFVIYRIHRQ